MDKECTPHNKQVCEQFYKAVELIGKKWTGAIISALSESECRFCDMRDMIPSMSDRLLTERLKELEANGIIERQVTTDRPLQVKYTLTKKGQDLVPILESIRNWMGKWRE